MFNFLFPALNYLRIFKNLIKFSEKRNNIAVIKGTVVHCEGYGKHPARLHTLISVLIGYNSMK